MTHTTWLFQRWFGILTVIAFHFLFSASLIAADQENHWVMISDTHIPVDLEQIHNGFNPNAQFDQVRNEILALDEKPAGIIISGDLVYLHGKREDYQTLNKQLAPFAEAHLPVYLLLGNHDNYDNFADILSEYHIKESPVQNRQIQLLETPYVNWFLLDSLEKTNSTPGLLGPEQLKWLADELDRHTDKPAVIVAHHDLDNSAGALQDRDAFWEIIKPRMQVKAYIYGHTHQYRTSVKDQVHNINLPALAWRFDKTQPLGWTDVTIREHGIDMTLHTFEKNHPKNNDVRTFEWLR